MFPTIRNKFGESILSSKLSRIFLVKKVKHCQFSFVFWLPSNETRDSWLSAFEVLTNTKPLLLNQWRVKEIYSSSTQATLKFDTTAEKALQSSGGGGNSAYYVTGTCHFSRKIGTHNSVNYGGF